MKETMTEIWAYVVAALIYGLVVWTIMAYFGEIVFLIADLMQKIKE